VKESLFGLERSLGKSERLACRDCVRLSRLQDGSSTQGTLILAGYTRSYDASSRPDVRLTSNVTDGLVVTLYGFELQRTVLRKVLESVHAVSQQARLIAASTILFGFTPTAAGMDSALKLIQKAIVEIETKLPDGIVTYDLDFGIRIGTGYIPSGKMIKDTVFIPGIYSLGPFLDRLCVAAALEKDLSVLTEETRSKVLLRLAQRRSLIALTKELIDCDVDLSKGKSAPRPRLTLHQVLQISSRVDYHPTSVFDLRRFGKTVGGESNVDQQT